MKQDEVRLVRAADTSTATTQTTGMTRHTGIDDALVGAQRLWMAHVTAHKGMNSGPHHHGEAESAIYVLRGQVRLYYGEGYHHFVEAAEGDFIFIPPYAPHIEVNLSDDAEAELLVTRSPSNIVVNLDDEAPPLR